MEKLEVILPSYTYSIYFENNFKKLADYLKEHKCNEKILIITDDNVNSFYGDTVLQILKENGIESYIHVVPHGENSKSLEEVKKIYDACFLHQLTRKSTLIALGGGVIGDLTGFIAATYMRGISFVQCPTTILSQSDSSIGGKVGINVQGHKNVMGAFHQPLFVYMGLHTLHTLPTREIKAGLAEVIKHGCIYDKDFFEFLMENKENILGLEINTIYKMIRRNCEIKSSVVSQDEKELGIRALLNFGHTFGHAVESLKSFRLLHGECVTIGMVMAAELSFLQGDINKEDRDRIVSLIKSYEMVYKVEDLTASDIYNEMYYDKKTEHKTLNLIALEDIGKAKIVHSPNEDLIMNSIEYGLNIQ